MIVKHTLTNGETVNQEHYEDWQGDIDAWLKRNGLLDEPSLDPAVERPDKQFAPTTG